MNLRAPSAVLVHLALSTGQILWSTMTIAIKFSLGYVNPFVLLFLRMAGSALIFHLMVLTRERALPTRRDFGFFVVMSLFGVVLYTSCFQVGLSLSTAVNALVLELGITVFCSCAALALKREAFSWLKIAGIALAVVGGLVMAEVERFEFTGQTFVGNILLLVNSVAFAFFSVFAETLLKRNSSAVFNSWTTTWAAVTYAVVNAALFREEWQDLFAAPPSVWASIVWIIVVGTVVASSLYTWALNHASSLVASAYFPLQALSGMLLAVVLLGEELSWRIAIGGLTVLAGLGLVLFSKYRESSTAPAAFTRLDEAGSDPAATDFVGDSVELTMLKAETSADSVAIPGTDDQHLLQAVSSS
eukprot:TRINITY_DN15695_c0_g1_i1.p1 TRINITY_DN15695_c0_g1~~TRINITY_DN15695_c0_g1_i1.p1  ORF type:complete len:383 (-),score=92.45 TRINITY_DN15695_c0_g1_i1:33-1109(-)